MGTTAQEWDLNESSGNSSGVLLKISIALPRRGCLSVSTQVRGWGQWGKQLKSLVKNTYSWVFFLEVKWFLTIELAIPLLSRAASLGGAVGVGGEG